MARDVARSLLHDDAADRRALGAAIARSVNTGVPLLEALLASGAAPPEIVARHLARTATPFLRTVAPARELVARLPLGLCERLLAVPVRLDAITGTVDVAVADANDPHPAEEIGFHLRAPVRVLRATLEAVHEGLRRLHATSLRPGSMPPASMRPGPRTSLSEPPRSADGSDIPIPLTRKTAYPPGPSMLAPLIPGPPALPVIGRGATMMTAPRRDPAELLDAVRQAASRDEALALVLRAAREVAPKVALFVVKKGVYAGWAGSPALASVEALRAAAIPADAPSVLERASREGLYLGPVPHDRLHAPIVRALGTPTRDVAVVPVRVAGRTAVVIVADELHETMRGTRFLDDLARAAGDAFARLVMTRR